jgi:hypothetical protein
VAIFKTRVNCGVGKFILAELNAVFTERNNPVMPEPFTAEI